MVAVAPREQLSWLSPAPLWHGAGDLSASDARRGFLRPAILRFATDDFMDEIGRVLAYHPERLHEWQARPETWERPMVTPEVLAGVAQPLPTRQVTLLNTQLARRAIRQAESRGADAALGAEDVPGAPADLKLYQPVQQRYYLVAASLVCQRPGLPDRTIRGKKQERVGFVLRRILLSSDAVRPSEDPAQWDEYAYVADDSGNRWQQVRTNAGDSADRLLPGEEQLGMFPLAYDELNGQRRCLTGGLIPVGRREAYLATPKAPTGSGSPGDTATSSTVDPRILLLQMRVTGPWAQLVQQAQDERENNTRSNAAVGSLDEPFDNPPGTLPDRKLTPSREQIQTASWYLLLDLERFLFNHAPDFWVALHADDTGLLDVEKELPLAQWLRGLVLNPALQGTLTAPYTNPELGDSAVRDNAWEVLVELAQDPQIGVGLEAVDVPYRNDQASYDERWPGFLFPLADPRTQGPLPFSVAGQGDLSGDAIDFNDFDNPLATAMRRLEELVQAALPQVSTAGMPEIHLPVPDNAAAAGAWFSIRCVYERPNCGPLASPVVSAPTQAFELASFFDPDAPARPARIPMPGDISLAGLRKFNKSTTLAMSDMLCGQVRRIRKLTLGDLVLSVLPWPFHKDLPDVGATGPCGEDPQSAFGMFCSLSIPIVTLCALILMIIMVALLDTIFRWVPYLFTCLPIPGFKGKKP